MPARSVLALALLIALPAWSADWMTVASDRLRRVELDRGSVLRAERGARVAWGRIVLSDAQAQLAGYREVRALNRYDCAARTFTIVKRVYFDANERPIREEGVDNAHPIGIKAGTADDRFFSEVCEVPAQSAVTPPATVRSLTRLAAQAERKAAAVQNQAKTEAAAEPPVRPRRVALDATTDSTLAERLANAANGGSATPPPPIAYAPPREVPQRVTPKAVAPRSWSYEGDTGPESWAHLSNEYAACARGQRQSPIDLRDTIKVDQEPLRIDYRPSAFTIVDSGRNIDVDVAAGSTLKVMGRTYVLTGVHFHHPAEERINGQSFDMTAHLVHRDTEGRIAILAVLLKAGKPNDAVQTLWNNLPLEKNQPYQPEAPLDISRLLPAEQGYFSYMGSLTTPPCTEGILWLVMKQPVDISREQIDIFTRFYRNNARPIQSANGRIIKESR
ncbi:MAG: carbonic anhydrase family protein [Rhodocyclaceae bacterium]